MDAKFLKDKRFWLASFLVAWAGALQAHMMWIQKQDSFKEKFGKIDKKKDGDE
ncbi:hexose transporter [Tasmannia lanceolata]|uniref:hexose transporter n=1 Tax=Tasmannia lanceolata TaxID=3420 RepID=UPI004062A06E